MSGVGAILFYGNLLRHSIVGVYNINKLVPVTALLLSLRALLCYTYMSVIKILHPQPLHVKLGVAEWAFVGGDAPHYT